MDVEPTERGIGSCSYQPVLSPSGELEMHAKGVFGTCAEGEEEILVWESFGRSGAEEEELPDMGSAPWTGFWPGR